MNRKNIQELQDCMRRIEAAREAARMLVKEVGLSMPTESQRARAKDIHVTLHNETSQAQYLVNLIRPDNIGWMDEMMDVYWKRDEQISR